MAKQLADVQIHASSDEDAEDDSLDISVDLIDDNLYLGNLTCARDAEHLRKLQVTHILTIDVVPLPRATLDITKLITKFVKLADVPKEDLISHLPETNDFIKQAIESGGTILVHCHFGVSRSAAVVLAYIMEKYQLCYEDAFTLVKSKRRFIGPNIGFVAQLKLFGHMGYRLNKQDPRYKQFRLKLAGQKLKQVKILPQLFGDLVRPDPGLARERPEPVVYRCRRCRRVVAGQSNIIPHVPRDLRLERARRAGRPPPSKLTGLNCTENGQILIEKLKSLACQINHLMKSEQETRVDISAEPSSQSGEDPGQSAADEDCEVVLDDEGPAPVLDGHSELNLVDGHIAGRSDAPSACRLMWFVEPMAWMARVTHDTHGKLHCPKCQNKIGSFSWTMGCKCPCGQKVAPAFYLVPSKVEWSNIVQNVQITV